MQWRLSRFVRSTGLWTGLLAAPILLGQFEEVLELSAFPVYAGTQLEPVEAQAMQLTERMKREVRVDMQSRGGARYQNDITIRGGIFEGTGLMVGGMALFDPQTGHYFSEIPLDPSFFSGARLLTGVANAVYGFNSTAGSIDWQWAPIETGNRLDLSAGSDGLLGVRAVSGRVTQSDWRWQLGGSIEEGDGSIANGDYRLERVSGRLEIPMGTGLLRVFGGHVSKFYGWPGMYTGISGLNETDDYHVSLVGWQWETGQGREGHRVGGYWRQLDDDYEFNRSSPNRFFEHLTEAWSIQGDGHIRQDWMDLSYRWALLRDRIRRSTSLVNGKFRERNYGEGAILVERRLSLRHGELVPYAGLALQSSDQDETLLQPQLGLRWTGSLADGAWEIYSEWSESSQVPGYTVLNSATSGLFGGNPDLGRETADTFEIGAFIQKQSLSAKVVFFQREDADLADWVFSSESPSARQASAVDISVSGVEGWLRWEGRDAVLEIGYAYLDKDAAYRQAGVDASFYALNFARHRILASAEKGLGESVRIRIEAEYREHPVNLLRSGGDDAMRLHLQAAWDNVLIEGLQLVLRLDNLTDESFEPVPGTPGPGRESRLTISYVW